jgi:hypothetical protein
MIKPKALIFTTKHGDWTKIRIFTAKNCFFPVKMTTITISPHLHSREARGVFRSFSVRIDPLDPRKTKKRRQ